MKRASALYLGVIVIFSLLLLQYYYYSKGWKQTRPVRFKCIYPTDIKHKSSNGKVKNILYWTDRFDQADFYLGFGSKIFDGCEFSNCFATDNRCHLPVDQFSAILFHTREYFNEAEDKPVNRSQNQYYVYVNQESPCYTPRWTGSNNFFNWTMTYRSDSDIVYPYGLFTNATANYQMPTVEDIRQKPSKIAWMVSHCNARSDRNVLYEKINKDIPVDVYGDCGTKTCPKENFNGCYDLLAKNYKFYLSFENSICSEYVTEKMFDALKRNVVPIVYGGSNYEKVNPPHSVIDVTKFSSVKELVNYIKFLDENPEKYLAYFEWKKKYAVKNAFHQMALCSLCKKLNQPIVHKSYSDIHEWWNHGMCSSGDKLPQVVFT